MYQSYSVNNMPKPVSPHGPEPKRRHEEPRSRHDEPRARCEDPRREPKRQPPPVPIEPKPERRNGIELPFLGRLHTDDIILLAVILLLLSEDCDDKLLLLALAYVFFSDYFDGKK